MHELHETWQAFVAGRGFDDARVAPPILRAWRRCVERGQPWTTTGPVGPPAYFMLSPQQARLVTLARAYIEDIYQFVEGSNCVVLLTDAQATAVELLGDAPMLRLLAELGLRLGSSWAEPILGANAIDLALREAQPIQTSGAEHFCAAYHGLSHAAAPLFDPAGQSLGALAVICPAVVAHPHTLGMVIAAAQALHNQLRSDQLLAEANDRLAELNATLEAMSEGLIFVGPDGDVSHINSRAGQMLGLSARSVAGGRIEDVLELPLVLRAALELRQDLADEELVFAGQGGKLVVLCNLRSVWDSGRRYLGALITLRPPETVQQLVQRVMGARAQLTFADIIGESPAIQLALRHARIAANSAANVLIEGELGVGKKLFAHAIHNASSRSQGPFVALSCVGLPRALLASELFGVEGAEGGGHSPGRPGKLELASGGTLLLEEVGALPMELQTDLLRAIENQRAIRGGSLRVVPINVRLIVTSSGDLAQALAEGRFRADLYHRLSGISIAIPGLRDRTDDLLLLQDHILRALSGRLGKQVVLAPDALEALRCYSWPGNVRELEVVLERLLHTTEKSVLTAADMPWMLDPPTPLLTIAPPRLQQSQLEAERAAILRAGQEAGGHVGRTAALLHISRATLWRKMRQHGISREQLIP